jgi:membrane-bound serine protease (ClpP class)
MTALLWVGALLLVGLGMLVLEVFLPAGGGLGFLSLVAIVAAVALAFVEHGVACGMGVLAFAFAAVPAVLGLAFRWFPDTPLGRRVLPPPPVPDDVVPDAERRRRVRELVGRRGRAASERLPWGSVEIGGERIDAVSEAGPVAAGTEIEVAAVQGTALVVRPAPPRPDPEALRAEPPEKPASAPAPRLSPVLEAFEFEDLGRPEP